MSHPAHEATQARAHHERRRLRLAARRRRAPRHRRAAQDGGGRPCTRGGGGARIQCEEIPHLVSVRAPTSRSITLRAGRGHRASPHWPLPRLRTYTGEASGAAKGEDAGDKFNTWNDSTRKASARKARTLRSAQKGKAMAKVRGRSRGGRPVRAETPHQRRRPAPTGGCHARGTEYAVSAIARPTPGRQHDARRGRVKHARQGKRRAHQFLNPGSLWGQPAAAAVVRHAHAPARGDDLLRQRLAHRRIHGCPRHREEAPARARDRGGVGLGRRARRRGPGHGGRGEAPGGA